MGTQKKQQAVANARDLMDDAARVRELTNGATFNLYSTKREKGIAASVSNAYLQRYASHQANHIIHTGVNYQQLMEFESAISMVEQENSGSMMTSDGINLLSSHAAKQRARNTDSSGLLGASMLTAESAAEAMGDSGRGMGSVGGGGQVSIAAEAVGYSGSSIRSIGGGGWVSSDGGQHAAFIDLVGGSGCSHSVTSACLKSSTVKQVSTPANWPFNIMLTWTRAWAMTRMTVNHWQCTQKGMHRAYCTGKPQ